jgi:hypothetical protein
MFDQDLKLHLANGGLTDCSTYMQAGWLAYMLYSTARKHELRVGYQPEGRQKIKRFKMSTDRID